MPAHIYARTGDHAAAARANLAGADADRVYLKTVSADNFYGLAYYTHNLHFLADSHMMQGRLADARVAAAELADRLAPHATMMPNMESMMVAPISVLLRFGRHDEILQLTAPAADRPVMAAWWRFARGVSYARLGRIDDAAAERDALEKASGAVPESALFGGTGLESARTILALARTVLDARIAWARGERDRSVALWNKAAADSERVPYDEPPIWFYPVRESLGAALLLQGNAAEAEQVFREDLDRFPRNPRSLFGLHEALVRLGRTSDAEWVKKARDEAWKNADVPLALEDF
jgi:tetratricopeptide (TPR) repeat protein